MVCMYVYTTHNAWKHGYIYRSIDDRRSLLEMSLQSNQRGAVLGRYLLYYTCGASTQRVA
jgi:hypothetical protein